MKKQLLLILMTLLPMVASADAVEINGIYYNLISKAKQAEVARNPNNYTGSVVIPEKVTYESVEYSVTSIRPSAFANCSGLTSVTIPNSVTSIGYEAFYKCSGLTSVTIGSGVTSIGADAFYNCSGLKKVIVKDIAAWCGIKFDDVDSNPLYSAKHIYSDEDTEITNLIIPNSVTSIGGYAFYYCSGLTSVTIGNSVTSIGYCAFYGCSGLTSVTIPNSVTSIGGYAFYYCSGLTSVTIGNSVTSIENRAFEGCSGLTSVTIGSGVTSIGERAFEYCSGLKKVIVKDIAAWCGIKFDSSISNPLGYAKHIYSDEDTEITNLIIPNSVTSIGSYAFSGCSGLTSVTIPNSVTYIGGWAFSGCSGLTSVTIPNSVTSIGDYAFAGCSGLTSVTIGSGVTSIRNYAFSGCSGLKKVIVKDIAAWCGIKFDGSKSNPLYYAKHIYSDEDTEITNLIIPNSVTSIGESAFFGCSGLTSVTIGSGIKTIYSSAFASCPELTDVTCYAENVPSTNTDAFKDSYIEYTTLHVPASAVNAYKVADPWKNFKSIMATDGTTPETPETPKCEKPTISYENGKLTFTSETEGAVCQYSITDTDIKAGSGNEVQLGVTYNISVYATKSGYDNSETATATLCWIDQQPKTEGITNGIANIPAQAVLIQSEGGSIKVQGVDEGTQVNVYGINGTQAGSAISQSGAATINTNLQPGSIAIVKIGQKSVKVVVK